MLFERDPQKTLEWKKTTGVDPDYGIRFSSKLIEFIFIVYLQLNLVYPENLNHPFSLGWIKIFQSWARIEVIKDAWLRYGAGYTKGFQIFAEGDPKNNAIGLPKNEVVAKQESFRSIFRKGRKRIQRFILQRSL